MLALLYPSHCERDTFGLTFLFVIQAQREKPCVHTQNRMKHKLFSQFSQDIYILNNSEIYTYKFHSRHVETPVFSRFFGHKLPLAIFSEKIQTENLFSKEQKAAAATTDSTKSGQLEKYKLNALCEHEHRQQQQQQQKENEKKENSITNKPPTMMRAIVDTIAKQCK